MAQDTRRELFLIFALACGITWTLDAPFAYHCLRGEPTPEGQMAFAGLGAFGPTVAAFVLARRTGTLRNVFGRWRPTSWLLVPAALFVPAALHFVATLIEVALGGAPARWFYPPTEPQTIVALVLFSVGEEFGWRGFAHPRALATFGPVRGALLVGLVWGLWHFFMAFTPETGLPSLPIFTYAVVELVLYSVVFAWLFERSGRSMAVAMALHAGGHLDNTSHAPETEVRLRLLRLLVVAIAAVLAGRAMQHDRARPAVS